MIKGQELPIWVKEMQRCFISEVNQSCIITYDECLALFLPHDADEAKMRLILSSQLSSLAFIDGNMKCFLFWLNEKKNFLFLNLYPKYFSQNFNILRFGISV